MKMKYDARAECRVTSVKCRMKHDNLKERTKNFALRIIQLVDSLPTGKTSDVIGRQLLRSGTSVAANYRSACRARSNADFISKMDIVEEESDEALFWMDLLADTRTIGSQRLEHLMAEANEILAITVTSIKTARKKVRN